MSNGAMTKTQFAELFEVATGLMLIDCKAYSNRHQFKYLTRQGRAAYISRREDRPFYIYTASNIRWIAEQINK